MEAANQKKLFVCKYCNKRYPCGKSLGGHIRTHMNNGNLAEAEGEAKLNIDKIFYGRKIKKYSSFEAGGQSGYGLRENGKKTRMFVDSKTLASQKEMFCKECGKGFQSLKAICGHMACHSEKDNKMTTNFQDHLEGSDLKQKLVMDSESDTETLAPSRLRRSKETGHMTIGAHSSSFDVANGSSTVSEIEQEQEEQVAMCLMMLSMDSSGCKKGLNSFANSSDNNSVVLEAKSSSIDMKTSAKNGVNYVSNGDMFVEMKKAKDGMLKSAEIVDVSDNSDSGYFRNGPKKAESDASVDGFIRTGKFNKSVVEYESGFEDLDAKLEKSSNKRTEFKKHLTKEEDFPQVDRALTKYGSRKRTKNDSSSPQIFFNKAQKRSEFECSTCNKVFHSPRSLWGHTASHSKINGCCESINESSENSIETDSFPMLSGKVIKSVNSKNPIAQNLTTNVDKRLGTKKSKGHECPFCLRVFKSGQALGGHKRSHFDGGSDVKRMVLKQEPDEMHGLIDLNLPAPVEDEVIGDAEFLQW